MACGLPVCRAAETFIINSIDFADSADWNRVFDLNRRILSVYISSFKPTTVVEAREGGEYYVWSYAPDFSSNPSTRFFSVAVNGKELPKYSGRHGFNGWKWELLGKADLYKGQNMVSLSAKTPFARSDAILFTTDASLDPNASLDTDEKRKPYLRGQEKFEVSYKSDLDNLQPMGKASESGKIEVQNGVLRLVFSSTAPPISAAISVEVTGMRLSALFTVTRKVLHFCFFAASTAISLIVLKPFSNSVFTFAATDTE